MSMRWHLPGMAALAVALASLGGGGHTSAFATQHSLVAAKARRLVGCVARGPSKVSHGSYNRREIALTFDDGPWNAPPASSFVNLLARQHVPATFFEIGSQLARFDASGRIERSMLANGDMIGAHTWSHPHMTRLSTAAQRSQLRRTVDAIKKRTGFTPCLWRPPYGSVNTTVIGTARSLGLLTIMWDVDPRDWSRPGSATIAARVTGAAHNGAIVIQHYGGGSRYQTLDALTREITTLRRKGYRFVTVTQLLGLRLIYR